MKNIILLIKDNYKLVLGVFIVGLLFGWIFFHSSPEATLSTAEVEGHEGHAHETENQVWTCSMHPQIKMDKPGKCPICSMELIPLATVSDDSEDTNPLAIVMSESARKMADIQTFIAAKGSPKKSVYMQGKVRADERNIAELTARFGGRIEKLFINFTGQEVQKGEILATIYSPELVTAQRELLEAISYKETRRSLYNAARGKLRLWDLTEKQIDDIEINGTPKLYFDVESPITGTVTKRNVAIGDYVKEGNPLFQVIDLSKLWVMFDAYESDLPWIKMGDIVNFTVQSLPGKNFSAPVTYIDPFLNDRTRVTQVRIEVSNKGGLLKPEMFTSGMLQSVIAQNSHQILIPKTSILWTGKRAIVYVKIQGARMTSFLYREIVLGPEAGAFYLVASGLEEGEEVATNGVFKIDAAAQLQGLPSMMNPDGGAGSTPHDMSKMGMGGDKKKGDSKIKMSDKEMKNMSTSEKTMDPMKMKNDADHTKMDTRISVAKDFQNQLESAFNQYKLLKDALTNDDANGAQKFAGTLLKSMTTVDMKLLTNMDAHNHWMTISKELNASALSISKTTDIAKQRSHFKHLSAHLSKAIKLFGVNQKVYEQFCPMAENNEGASWLSQSEKIRNPYLGEAMLGCGENRETIK